MKLLKKLAVVTVGAAFIGLSTVGKAEAITLMSDNFEAEQINLFQTNLANFTTTNNTNIDVLGSGLFDLLPGNGKYLDLDGTGNNSSAKLVSKASFNLLPGNLYQLQFNLAGSQRGDTNTVKVSLGTVFNETFQFASAVPFTPIVRSFSVAAPISANLVFDHTYNPNDTLGLLLDNVSLTSTSNSTPVPFEFSPGLGILALGACGAIAQLNSIMQKRKFFGIAFFNK